MDVGPAPAATMAEFKGVRFPLMPIVNNETSLLLVLATYAYFPDGSTVMADGLVPAVTVGVLIGERLPLAPIVY